MKAAFIKEFGNEFAIEETPVPQPGPGEILLRVEASCLCQADVKIRKGSMPQLKLPHLPGHEIAGTVAALGEGVTGHAVGDRRVVYMYQVCCRCPACRSGHENLCVSLTRLGFEIPGGHAEYVVIKADQAIPLPDNIPFRDAAAIPDAVCTSLHALREQAGLKLADTLLIYGVGGLGMHAVQIAKHMGCFVIGVARSTDKLAQALAFGADAVINASKEDVAAEALKFTNGRGVDAVVDYVVSTDTLGVAISSLRKGGTYVLVGSAEPRISFPVGQVMFKEISIRGSLGMTRQTMLDAVALVAAGAVKPYVTEEYPLDELNIAAQRLGEGKVLGRAVILPAGP